jgi:hypothetical protein
VSGIVSCVTFDVVLYRTYTSLRLVTLHRVSHFLQLHSET